MKPVIFGLAGLSLSPDEAAFFRDAAPAGYILFGRNIETRAQLRALTDSLRELHGDDRLPILIDQEGGRVSRMKPPEWLAFPPGAAFDKLYDIAPASAIEAARANAEALALDLAEVGITVDCLPLLDVAIPGGTPAIGDRALGQEPLRVAALGRAVLDGLRRGGVLGTIKHMPGHGRALVDSHMELPRVTASEEELEQDIAPFRALASAEIGMTGHILFEAWDKERCATHSPWIVEHIIRQRIGFEGLLLSDDLDMKALAGQVPDRAARAIEAGCDIALNCWARMDEMIGIVNALPDISDVSRARLDRARAAINPVADWSHQAELIARRDALLALA
ncbi:beta-N-acetylhexosaminidase [Blastomonas natatoria]|uniref:beta-N-acetylhexosaminidase n=1 Tax=Blastomonas natatoria TaxID=34015 RepID=A0A2V3VAY5_9SPHN|nr:beta-N-acetylhexosaminidase [Blastomonas natatoria]PXW78972.1 beta-N-acetylhexosaminidase [Blastomonas natatoria]